MRCIHESHIDSNGRRRGGAKGKSWTVESAVTALEQMIISLQLAREMLGACRSSGWEDLAGSHVTRKEVIVSSGTLSLAGRRRVLASRSLSLRQVDLGTGDEISSGLSSQLPGLP